MANKHKEIFNLGIATIVGTIVGLSLENLALGAITGIAVGIVLSIINKPN
ncbi:hypothetical protein LG198_02315 [Methylobacillus arboreus]|nr:hypothetical protein [Methylobacillus arboreus]MCB5189565.1 hypothetical protein [Methylobacillus arboreus]